MYAVSSYIHEQISAQFEEYDHELKLNGKKKTTLVIFLLTLPCMISHIAKPETIVDGFVACGMLDNTTKTCPDMNQILATCHRNITLDEHDLCRKKFKELYKLNLDQVHVTDDVYKQIGSLKMKIVRGKKCSAQPQLPRRAINEQSVFHIHTNNYCAGRLKRA